MSTEVTENEKETVAASPKLTASVKAWESAVSKAEIARDTMNTTAKSETLKHGYTKQQLTALLLGAMSKPDPRTASEVAGFVFPAHAAARKELDKAMEFNAKQSDPKKRIAKQVILALQRDKEGKLTLEKAKAEHDAAKQTRQAGGQTNQTATKKLTPKEIEEALGNLMAAALNFAKKHEYDLNDVAAIVDEIGAKVYGGEVECSIEHTPAETEGETSED